MTRSCLFHECYLPASMVSCSKLGVVPAVSCSGCKSFELKRPRMPQRELKARPVARSACRHLGSQRRCCGELFICRKHKIDCIRNGTAVAPVLSCETCPDYVAADAGLTADETAAIWPPCRRDADNDTRVGFIAASYLAMGGTETFHQSLIPRLKDCVQVVGFVATSIHGGDGGKLGVPFSTGLQAARRLAAHCDVVVAWGIEGLATLLPADRPRVIAVHHSDLSSDWSNEQIVSQLDMIDEIICVNEGAAAQLQSCGKPVHHISNAIDPIRITPSGEQSRLREKHSIPAESKLVLFGHRLSPEKRPLLAVEIAKQLPPDWTMVIAGDGPELDVVKASAGNSDRVRIVGRCESLADWLAVSSCFLSLSTFEGFGLSVGEAVAAGVPTISTATGIATGLATTLPIDATPAEWAEAIVNAKRLVQPEVILDQKQDNTLMDY